MCSQCTGIEEKEVASSYDDTRIGNNEEGAVARSEIPRTQPLPTEESDLTEHINSKKSMENWEDGAWDIWKVHKQKDRTKEEEMNNKQQNERNDEETKWSIEKKEEEKDLKSDMKWLWGYFQQNIALWSLDCIELMLSDLWLLLKDTICCLEQHPKFLAQ
ncbi:hypothetical protein RFI_23120 [Reticulomyxa filosa]|uniref:Uncharacterized protein n=1 Tax=Reticulomyxa filosa TaxID=46433 RepID=X6MLB4_RETFI|nr:hypothetical protein RFI_23120 [Reticulomyxa filosa]|eukprot:ETO14247.1 hypothetical protein RFI_23120 [Reticulomyxa filosa]